MERHANKTNVPETIKAPIQSITKNKRPIFVYIRRSTRNKQELSIQRQEDNARETIEQAGYNPDEVEYYIESMTAYNGVKIKNGSITRRRIEFTRMLHDIDNSKYPVTLLTYEDSRLSRNDPDTTEILARLFGEYEKDKKNIEKIIFNGGEVWTEKSNKGDVKQRLLDRYKESLKISERSSKATLRELRKGRYILSTPVGIERLKKGETELEISDIMPIIIKAWEMKANGKSKREITSYLQKNNLKIGDTFEQYFRKTIYIGKFLDPETGEYIDINFKGGKPPMALDLWEKVQKTLGVRRISKYGKKQEGDIISRLLKWEHDEAKAFSVEFPKGKYKSYKNNAYGRFNKSEKKIMEVIIPCIVNLFLRVYYITLEKDIKEGIKRSLDKKEFILKNFQDTKLNQKEIEEDWFKKTDVFSYLKNRYGREITYQEFGEGINNSKADGSLYEFFGEFYYNISIDSFLLLIKEKGNIENMQKGIEEKNELLKKKKQDKEKMAKEFEEQKINLAKLLGQGILDPITYQNTLNDYSQKLGAFEKEILEISEKGNFEEFIERLPEILMKTFELSKKAFSYAEINDIRGELEKLIEITTFELSINTKKELKVKLFEGFESVMNPESDVWLAPSHSIRTFVENYDRVKEKYGISF